MITIVWELVKPYIWVIIIGLILFYLLYKLPNLILREMQARIHQRWLDKRERKKQEREQRQELARQNEHRYIHANNWLLNMIIKTRIIIFKGLAGKGKTLLMQVFTKFLVDKFEYADRKNRRYNKLMNPNYIEQREKLKKEGYLPVYSNMEGVEDPKPT